tara:strand:- start:1129 stop:1359 length:231 start_codon:yes stop_codon:yes gene_type:complete
LQLGRDRRCAELVNVFALEAIVSGVGNVQSMVNSLASAAEEQTAVAKEITADIKAISDIPEQSLQLATLAQKTRRV